MSSQHLEGVVSPVTCSTALNMVGESKSFRPATISSSAALAGGCAAAALAALGAVSAESTCCRRPARRWSIVRWVCCLQAEARVLVDCLAGGRGPAGVGARACDHILHRKYNTRVIDKTQALLHSGHTSRSGVAHTAQQRVARAYWLSVEARAPPGRSRRPPPSREMGTACYTIVHNDRA